MKRAANLVKAVESELRLWTGQFDTNNTSAPDGKSANLTSVTRTAAGKYTVVLKDRFPQCLFPKVSIVGATAGYYPHITAVTTSGGVSGFTIEVHAASVVTAAVAATGTLTADAKASTTDLDYYVLNDGNNKAMLWFNVSGTQAAKYSKLGSKATTTVTFPAFNDLTNEDYFTVWDGHRFWKIMMDTDASGDSTSTADIVVDVSAGAGYGAGSTAAQMATAVHDMIMETTSVVATTAEAIHLTSTDNADGTLTLTCDFAGYDGNGTNTENFTHASGLITAATGGTDAFPAEEFAEVDVSGATTATDVMTVIHGVINALTEVQITSTDPADGNPLTLTNDQAGPAGNASQQFSETGSTAMNLTDMTGGVDGTAAAPVATDTTDYTVYMMAVMRDTQRTWR